jgi:hypothetical protein
MDRIIATITEDETYLTTSSSETTGHNLPTVTPKQRSFADTVTVTKQNRENKALREKILREKIAELQSELYEQALDYNATDPYGGRTPSQQKPVPPL